LLRRLLLELDETGPQSLTPQVRTFRQLIEYYTDNYVVPARYVDGKKVSGLRSHNKVKSFLKPISDYFGDMHLPALSYSHLEKYRLRRLAEPTVHDKQRSITAVNRELEVIRKLLNIAVRERWLNRSPFGDGEPLIVKSHERKRERILSFEEEDRLLSVCVEP